MVQAARTYRFLARALEIYPYQPLYGVDSRAFGHKKAAVRACLDRWDAFKPHLPRSGSALDIGCQNGFFTLMMAEHGLATIGVEREGAALRVCQILALANKPLPAAFLPMEISDETVEKLPRADVVLCLSIFHNWARDLGFDRADRIMRVIAARTGSVMIFETGQSDQTDVAWAQRLAFMGDDPRAWISDYLVDLGFTSVKQIGAFAGTTKHYSTRYLFVARKD